MTIPFKFFIPMLVTGGGGILVATHCNDYVTKPSVHESKALDGQAYFIYLPKQ